MRDEDWFNHHAKVEVALHHIERQLHQIAELLAALIVLDNPGITKTGPATLVLTPGRPKEN